MIIIINKYTTLITLCLLLLTTNALAAHADATGELNLSAKYEGAANLLKLGDLAAGTKSLSGYGSHSESADGSVKVENNIWNLDIFAKAWADSVPTSKSDSNYKNSLGTIFLISNNADNPGAKDERVNITFSASVFLDAHVVGDFSNASASSDYLIYANHLGLGLPGVHFMPSISLMTSAPPASNIFTYTREEQWQFFLNPGDQVVVNLRSANIKADAFTSTIPVPAAVWLFGSGLIGLMGMRQKNNIPA